MANSNREGDTQLERVYLPDGSSYVPNTIQAPDGSLAAEIERHLTHGLPRTVENRDVENAREWQRQRDMLEPSDYASHSAGAGNDAKNDDNTKFGRVVTLIDGTGGQLGPRINCVWTPESKEPCKWTVTIQPLSTIPQRTTTSAGTIVVFLQWMSGGVTFSKTIKINGNTLAVEQLLKKTQIARQFPVLGTKVMVDAQLQGPATSGETMQVAFSVTKGHVSSVERYSPLWIAGDTTGVPGVEEIYSNLFLGSGVLMAATGTLTAYAAAGQILYPCFYDINDGGLSVVGMGAVPMSPVMPGLSSVGQSFSFDDEFDSQVFFGHKLAFALSADPTTYVAPTGSPGNTIKLDVKVGV